jgi:hypothetical protein
MQIGIGEKFSCLAFTGFSVAEQFPDELRLDEGTWALRGLPVGLPDHWWEALGSLKAEDIQQSNFVLCTITPSRTPEVLDQENIDLTQHLYYVMFGLLLQEVPQYDNGYTLTGANVGGEIQVRQYGELNEYSPSYGMPEFYVGVDELNRAFSLANKLHSIYGADADWLRLRTGLNVLFKGSEEKRWGDRLHQFVRALEALIKPEEGRSRRQFAHRGQTFAIANLETRDTLLQIFDIRSKVEHIHSPLDALNGTEEERNILGLRKTRQVDVLSRFALTHVLESEVFLNIFESDTSIDEFWRLPDHERVQAWGERLDLAGVQ